MCIPLNVLCGEVVMWCEHNENVFFFLLLFIYFSFWRVAPHKNLLGLPCHKLANL